MDAELEVGADLEICTEIEDLLTPIALADNVSTGEAEIDKGCVLVGDASELEMLGEGPLYNQAIRNLAPYIGCIFHLLKDIRGINNDLRPRDGKIAYDTPGVSKLEAMHMLAIISYVCARFWECGSEETAAGGVRYGSED